jgi:hypothetical protein
MLITVNTWKSSWMHPKEPLGDMGPWVMSNLISVHLETVLVSVQDRCMVCVKHSIGSAIILDEPGGTPR